MEAPVGFSLSGEMSGYGSGKTTTKISEGLALHVAEKVNSEGHIIHQYSINGEVIKDRKSTRHDGGQLLCAGYF